MWIFPFLNYHQRPRSFSPIATASSQKSHPPIPCDGTKDVGATDLIPDPALDSTAPHLPLPRVAWPIVLGKSTTPQIQSSFHHSMVHSKVHLGLCIIQVYRLDHPLSVPFGNGCPVAPPPSPGYLPFKAPHPSKPFYAFVPNSICCPLSLHSWLLSRCGTKGHAAMQCP